jgi:hypothetical protein
MKAYEDVRYPTYEDVLKAEREARELRNKEIARLFGVLWTKIVAVFTSDSAPKGAHTA